MRIQILSDLHLEFDRDGGEAFARSVPVAGDLLVLAGDVLPLCTVDSARRMFSGFCDRFQRVIFVPGNHEYYRTCPANAESLLATCAHEITNLHVLNPGVTTIDGTRFVGATLWYPETKDELLHRGAMNDFRLITDFVPWVHETHRTHLEFLKTAIRPGDVVVTHHLPHPRSISPRYAGSSLNRFFVAEDAAELVAQSGARLWIHGHTHTACDYSIGATRVVCNPRGYPSEYGNGFDIGTVVEV
jgi:predicted phosphodiesterase